MLLVLNIIWTYPLVLYRLECYHNKTYIYLNINCPLKCKLILKYNYEISDPETWNEITTIKPNGNLQIIVKLESFIKDGYYTFKLINKDFYTYCRPIKKVNNMFNYLGSYYTHKFGKINRINNKYQSSDKNKSLRYKTEFIDDINNYNKNISDYKTRDIIQNVNHNPVQNNTKFIYSYLNYFLGLFIFFI